MHNLNEPLNAQSYQYSKKCTADKVFLSKYLWIVLSEQPPPQQKPMEQTLVGATTL
jgi:hypothetical protein